MRQTKISKLYEVLEADPTTSYEDLATAIDSSVKVVRVYIKRLEEQGKIKIDDSGNIECLVRTIANENYKRDIYEIMVESYLDDFEKAEFYSERVEIGKLILRLLEKL